MKKATLIIFILAVVVRTNAQTTVEEYRYVTIGYGSDLQTGHDIKSGYEVKDVDYVPEKGANGSIVREAYLKAFNRVSTNGVRTIAAYMIIYQRSGSVRQYFCIPSPGSSQNLSDAYFNSLVASDALGSTDKLQLITFLLSRSLRWQ